MHLTNLNKIHKICPKYLSLLISDYNVTNALNHLYLYIRCGARILSLGGYTKEKSKI